MTNLFLAILPFDTLLAVTKSEKIKLKKQKKKQKIKQYWGGGDLTVGEEKVLLPFWI